MVPGDRRLLDYTLEDEAFDEQMRGMEVVCDVNLRELFSWELPQVQIGGLSLT